MMNLERNQLLEIVLFALIYTLLPTFLMVSASINPILLVSGIFLPLPVYLIALKKGYIAGLYTVILGFFFSLLTGINFSLLIMGLPAIFLCHKALKSRLVLNNRLEWYPLSLLVQWSAVFAIGIALVVSTILYLFISPQPQTFLDMFIRFNPSLKDKFTLESINTLYTYVPGIFACYWVVLQFLNGYIAQRILEKFKKNIRPMPSIFNFTIKYYWYYALSFCLIMILLFDGIYDRIFQNLAFCLMIPYFFTGLSIFHHSLKLADNRLKPFIFMFYILFFLLPTLSLIIVALGIVEPWVELRKKIDTRLKK